MSLSLLFLDLNAYFASVEQQVRPKLRGHPVAVVPVMTDRTCCIAVSYEARPYGIRTGTMVGEARRLCPHIQLVEARTELYVDYHHRVLRTVETCLPVQMVHSIDEMSCRLLRNERDTETAIRIAMHIKKAIREQVGEIIRCSIGLAPNVFLAKVASKMQKPDGLVVLQKEELPRRLYGLRLGDLHGVGAGMLRRMAQFGITSVEQLCTLNPAQLERVCGGIVGRRLWYAIRGYDSPPKLSLRRTVGHSHVLPPELRTREAAHAVLTRLIHKAAARMRSLEFVARKMSIDVRFSFTGSWSAWTHLGLCQDTLTALEGFERLWPRCPRGSPLLVGITFFDLAPCSCATLPLFPEDAARTRLSQAMDRINQTCGRQAVFFGGMFGAEDSAPDRIAFTQIPDLNTVS